MKTFTSLLALIGILAVAGCSSPRGGTAEDYDYNSGSYSSDNNVPSTVTPNIPPADDRLPQTDNPSINSSGAGAVPPVPPP
ncbi:MAG TPA: hypothetical protein VIV82_05910 [Verrucomicrobiae bacterium]